MHGITRFRPIVVLITLLTLSACGGGGSSGDGGDGGGGNPTVIASCLIEIPRDNEQACWDYTGSDWSFQIPVLELVCNGRENSDTNVTFSTTDACPDIDLIGYCHVDAGTPEEYFLRNYQGTDIDGAEAFCTFAPPNGLGGTYVRIP